MLEEAGQLDGKPPVGVGLWPNADGAIELYSPWASAMKGFLAYGLKAESGHGAACVTYEDCEHRVCPPVVRRQIRPSTMSGQTSYGSNR